MLVNSATLAIGGNAMRSDGFHHHDVNPATLAAGGHAVLADALKVGLI